MQYKKKIGHQTSHSSRNGSLKLCFFIPPKTFTLDGENGVGRGFIFWSKRIWKVVKKMATWSPKRWPPCTPNGDHPASRTEVPDMPKPITNVIRNAQIGRPMAMLRPVTKMVTGPSPKWWRGWAPKNGWKSAPPAAETCLRQCSVKGSLWVLHSKQWNRKSGPNAVTLRIGTIIRSFVQPYM